MGDLFKYFSLLAIFISSLGVLGLASFLAQERTKEIGIRKVLGASRSKILVLLSKDFMLYLVLSNIISWPIVYIVMKNWLQNWAYHTQFHILFFIFGALISGCVVVLSVTYQTVKTAAADPIVSLHYE
jgi:ABC-type antimicrobial peptide transport system permease subunit